MRFLLSTMLTGSPSPFFSLPDLTRCPRPLRPRAMDFHDEQTEQAMDFRDDVRALNIANQKKKPTANRWMVFHKGTVANTLFQPSF